MRELIFKHVLINAVKHQGKAEPQAVLKKIIAEKPELKQRIEEIIPEIKKVVDEVNSLTLEQQKNQIKEFGISLEREKTEEAGLPELPNAIKGKVVMRLAPYPSGPLHIGNARMAILNDEYVKRYNGKLLLVIDDTIGSEEKFVIPEAYRLIIDGLKWLGVRYHKILYKSDRLNLFYKFIKQLIEKDAAYVCECSVETLRKNRAKGLACRHRYQTIETNLKKWNKMLKGDYSEGRAVVRLKTDMKHPNPAFRDRVLARIVERKHPRVGKKYKVWGSLEASWAMDDHLLGVTHILRGKDLVIEDMVEEYIWNIMKWKKPIFIHHGMMRLEGLKLSKTESRKAIERKIYTGWDDPRTWSLQSLRKRGIQPEAIRNFIIKMGLSLADVTVPTEILYAENRKMIDSIANRLNCIIDPIMISINHGPKIEKIKALMHPDFPRRGKREIPVNVKKIYIEKEDFEKFKGKEVGLIDLFTVKLGKKSEFVSKEVKYEIPKIHWVSEPNVKVEIIMPDGITINGISEPWVKKLKEGELVQFLRFGFARLDQIKDSKPIFYFSHK